MAWSILKPWRDDEPDPEEIDGEYRCIRCGAAFEREHAECPQCGGRFLAPLPDAEEA